MPQGTMEHANLTVSDIERSSELFQKLLGWRQRWRGEAMNGGETIHVGDDRSYLASTPTGSRTTALPRACRSTTSALP